MFDIVYLAFNHSCEFLTTQPTTSEVWNCIYSWINGTSELEGRIND